jgi:hypothetical protein
METAEINEMGPTIISAAASSSPARWPWVTITPAILGWVSLVDPGWVLLLMKVS